ncbi:MAG: stage V sporulation protein D [Bacilli bacterium]|nr:stage V sporulation protein D [Bacilli bacterium]
MIHFELIKKIKIIRGICFALFLSIIIKLSYSMIMSHEYLKSLATNLWERSFPIEASRGLIYDRNGNKIAINVPVTSVAVIPYQIKNKEEVAKNLSNILNTSYTNVLNKISKKASIVRLQPEGRQINDEQANKIKSLNYKGVYLIQDSKRYYPYETSLSQSLGFCGIDNQGLAGIEAYYDTILKGKNGSLNYKMDAKGGLFSNYQSTINAPVSGMSIGLTINMDIQNSLERELENAYLKYNPESILGIAMDPNSGEILAISNRPTYNPNNYKEYDQEIYNRNLAVWKCYEPGSTFKVFSFAAGLEENKFDMYKDTYYDRGYEIVGGRTIKSWKKGGHGLQTFLEVLENSSNPGFVEISRRLGADTLYDYILDFGFNSKTNVDIEGEAKGIFFSKDNYHELENATSSFGQGISVTPIQMVTAFSSIINGGYLYQPYIVKEVIHSSTDDVILSRAPSVKRQVISKKTSDLMRIALESVVSKGSGRNAYIDGYRVGGKTGSAQIAENGVYLPSEYILSFIGAAPMNDPQIVVYIAIEKPKSTIQYGGTVAAPIVRNVLYDSLKILNILPNNDGIEREYTWLDTKSYKVDNYIGLSKKEAKSHYFKFEFIGDGNEIIDQIPKKDTIMNQGNTIVLILK